MLLERKAAKILGLLAGCTLLLACIYLSISLGVVKTGWQDILRAYSSFTGSNENIVIRDIRIPRALIGAATGASLGIAGTLLQVLTRNPLADTGILGINSGAAFFVVVSVSFFSVGSLSGFMWIAFAGAAIGGCLVYLIGSMGSGGMTPLKITLAGAAVSAMASSFTHGLLVINEKTLNEVLFWLTGSVQGRKLEMLLSVLPYMIIAWIGAFIIARPLNILLMGDDVAKSLGQRTVQTKIAAGVLVILLSGSSVAIAGPIAFVGLVAPHTARHLTGTDLRWSVPYSGCVGAILLLVADILARFVAMPGEIPVGVMTAIIGSPFFILIARRKGVKA